MCSPGWSYNPTTGACYGVNKLPPRLSWMGAEEYCEKSGGHLASFQTQEEYEHLLSYFFVSWDEMWIGIYSDDGEKWKTVEGHEIDILKFGKWCTNGYPGKFDGKHCLGFGSTEGVNHCFHNHDCSTYKMRIICKKQIF
uniref:C-type lectin domain-containing protein n=1 Tax=Panagrolaimus davidi TaxID=227884 RepID=A0A914PTJ7_9BILA